MKPVVKVASLTDPEGLAEADLLWWLEASPAERLAGVAGARADWCKLRPGMAHRDTNRDYEDLIRLLNREGARFLVVGGYAVSFHVGPRFTKDIDLLLEPTLENAQRVLAALNEFIGDTGVSPERLAKPDAVFMIGVPPTRVDLLTSIPGVEFSSAWERRAPGTYGQEAVAFLGLDDLIRAKRAAGRPQDHVDAERLERARALLGSSEPERPSH